MNKLLLLFLYILFYTTTLTAQNEGWAICNSGANLYFKIVGSGTNTVLLVGDAGHSSEYMKDLIEKLSETNRVVYYDARATGKSRLPVMHDSTINFNKAVEDIEALRQVLRIQKWSVIGHGLGANIACAYASQAKTNIHQLVLINPSSLKDNIVSKTDDYFDTFEDYNFTKMLPQASINQRFTVLQEKLKNTALNIEERAKTIMAFQSATYVYDTLHEPLAINFLYEKIKNRIIQQWISQKSLANSTIYFSTLKQQNIPTLIIGSKQRQDYTYLIKSWYDKLPKAQFVAIDKAHHFPWLDNPRPFYKTINTFLKPPASELYASQQKKVSRPIGSGYQRRKRS